MPTEERNSRAVCPRCSKSKAGVTETRATTQGVRRRRQCKGCGFKWTTLEVVLEQTADDVQIDEALRLMREAQRLLQDVVSSGVKARRRANDC